MAVAVPRADTEEMCLWHLDCDEAGCRNFVSCSRSTDREAIDAVVELAIALGWLIAPDRFVHQRDDLCPTHRKDNR